MGWIVVILESDGALGVETYSSKRKAEEEKNKVLSIDESTVVIAMDAYIEDNLRNVTLILNVESSIVAKQFEDESVATEEGIRGIENCLYIDWMVIDIDVSILNDNPWQEI